MGIFASIIQSHLKERGMQRTIDNWVELPYSAGKRSLLWGKPKIAFLNLSNEIPGEPGFKKAVKDGLSSIQEGVKDD